MSQTHTVAQPLKEQRLREFAGRKFKHVGSNTSLVCDGHTDNAAALQSLINTVGQSGGGLIDLPKGTCAVSQTITVAYSNVTLMGEGAGFPASQTATIATGLLWIGAPGGTLLQYGSTTMVQGGGLTGIALLSNNGTAGYGLRLVGAQGGTYASFTADAFTSAAIDLGYTSLDQMNNLFMNYNLVDEVNTGAGIIVGTKSFNSAYYNEFDDGFIQMKYGTGIAIYQSDGNLFTNTHEFMAAGGTGLGVLFGCGSTSNHFVWLSAGFSNNTNGVVVLGIKPCKYPHEAWADSISLYDQNDNGGPPPVVGNGTDFTCTNDAGKPCGSQSPH